MPNYEISGGPGPALASRTHLGIEMHVLAPWGPKGASIQSNFVFLEVGLPNEEI